MTVRHAIPELLAQKPRHGYEPRIVFETLVSGIKILFPMGYFFPLSGIAAAVIIGLLFGYWRRSLFSTRKNIRVSQRGLVSKNMTHLKLHEVGHV